VATDLASSVVIRFRMRLKYMVMRIVDDLTLPETGMTTRSSRSNLILTIVPVSSAGAESMTTASDFSELSANPFSKKHR
jgi:hypothetical protein